MVPFCFHFCFRFQENLKIASTSASMSASTSASTSASMLPDNFNKIIFESEMSQIWGGAASLVLLRLLIWGAVALRVPHGFGLCPSRILVLLNKSLFKVFLCIYFPYSILHTCSWSYMFFPTRSHSHFSAISCPYRWQALGQNAGEREGLINLIQTIKNTKQHINKKILF